MPNTIVNKKGLFGRQSLGKPSLAGKQIMECEHIMYHRLNYSVKPLISLENSYSINTDIPLEYHNHIDLNDYLEGVRQ